MATVNPITVAAAASTAGFTGNDLVIATAIPGPESTYDNTATHTNADGSTDYGLWQINSKNTAYAPAGFFPPGNGWQDPVQNAMVAKKIKDAQGWKAWTTYTSGAYQQWLPVAQQATSYRAVGGGPDQTVDSGSPLGDFLSSKFGEGVPSSVGDALTQAVFPSFLNGLSSTLWVGGGVLLVVLGMLMLAKNEVNPITLAKALT